MRIILLFKQMSLLIINYSDTTAAMNSFYENIYTALEAQGHLEFVDFSPKDTSLLPTEVCDKRLEHHAIKKPKLCTNKEMKSKSIYMKK